MTDEQRNEFLRQSIESHDRQLGEITDKLATLGRTVETLTQSMARMAAAMTTLAETVTGHERRISGLEGAQ
jgi:hypothetical protein